MLLLLWILSEDQVVPVTALKQFKDKVLDTYMDHYAWHSAGHYGEKVRR